MAMAEAYNLNDFCLVLDQDNRLGPGTKSGQRVRLIGRQLFDTLEQTGRRDLLGKVGKQGARIHTISPDAVCWLIPRESYATLIVAQAWHMVNQRE
jgi:hypothetical protein